MAPAPSRKIVLFVVIGCTALILFSVIGRCSMKLVGGARDMFSEMKQTQAVLREAFNQEPEANLDHVKLCIRDGYRTWAVKWHPTVRMSDDDVRLISDRIWTKVSAREDAPRGHLVLRARGYDALVYGGDVPESVVDDCFED
jgi:hypothetical protein